KTRRIGIRVVYATGRRKIRGRVAPRRPAPALPGQTRRASRAGGLGRWAMFRRPLAVLAGVVLVAGAGRMAATAAHDAAGRRDLADARLARAERLIGAGDLAAARTVIDEAVYLDPRGARGFALR